MNPDSDPFEPTPEERAKDLRFFSAWAEKKMWSWLRNRRLGGDKFRRQHPLGECGLDFFCNEAMLAIEIEGSQHGHPGERKRAEE
jgi:adenine-specific DNA-methyltransferase